MSTYAFATLAATKTRGILTLFAMNENIKVIFYHDGEEVEEYVLEVGKRDRTSRFFELLKK